MRILLGVTAGIAAYKAVHVARGLREAGHEVHVVPTAASLQFVGAATWEAISGNPVATSVFENIDQVNHVRLGQEADLVIIAPATADSIARMRLGRADDLLTSSLLATEAPVLVAPAMHTEMWRHPATVENVETLRRRGVTVMEPGSGRLTGSDSGPGRLPEPEQILEQAEILLRGGSERNSGAGDSSGTADNSDTGENTGTGFNTGTAENTGVHNTTAPQQHGANQPGRSLHRAGDLLSDPTSGGDLGSAGADLSPYRVLVTAGGTREPLDPVRFIGNRSSGKQGFALAATALARGAHVTLILGPSDPIPAELTAFSESRLTVIDIETTEELLAAVLKHSVDVDALVMAAAVADYRPARYSAAKMKKSADASEGLHLELVRNPDVLAQTVRRRRATGEGPTCIVGFAAETAPEDAGDPATIGLTGETNTLRELAETKLLTKGCELLVLNEVGTGKVFGRDDTAIEIFASFGVQGVLGESGARRVEGSKAQAADAIWDQVRSVLTAYQRLG